MASCLAWGGERVKKTKKSKNCASLSVKFAQSVSLHSGKKVKSIGIKFHLMLKNIWEGREIRIRNRCLKNFCNPTVETIYYKLAKLTKKEKRPYHWTISIKIWGRTPSYNRDIFRPPTLLKMRFQQKLPFYITFPILKKFGFFWKALIFLRKKAFSRNITILSASYIKFAAFSEYFFLKNPYF